MRRLEGEPFDSHRLPIKAMIEDMRRKIIEGHPDSDKYRTFIGRNADIFDDERNGIFQVCTPSGVLLHVIVGNGGGWDHVSVSTAMRCPTWEEMSFIKRMFFKASETVMQLHLSEREHINCHPYTLHLWRPHRGTIPLPPKDFV